MLLAKYGMRAFTNLHPLNHLLNYEKLVFCGGGHAWESQTLLCNFKHKAQYTIESVTEKKLNLYELLNS
jgi:hypothetical protein